MRRESRTNAPGSDNSRAADDSARWGSVYITASTDGGTCVGFKLDGGTSVGCDQPAAVAGHLALSVGSDRSHSWIEGQVPANVHRLRISLRNGDVLSMGAIHRWVLYRLEHSALVDRGFT